MHLRSDRNLELIRSPGGFAQAALRAVQRHRYLFIAPSFLSIHSETLKFAVQKQLEPGRHSTGEILRGGFNETNSAPFASITRYNFENVLPGIQYSITGEQLLLTIPFTNPTDSIFSLGSPQAAGKVLLNYERSVLPTAFELFEYGLASPGRLRYHRRRCNCLRNEDQPSPILAGLIYLSTRPGDVSSMSRPPGI